jgi:hypothetical protein
MGCPLLPVRFCRPSSFSTIDSNSVPPPTPLATSKTTSLPLQNSFNFSARLLADSQNDAAYAKARLVGMIIVGPAAMSASSKQLPVKRGTIDSHRDVLVRFLKASIEGNYLALTNEKRAKEVLAKEVRVSDPKIIDTSYDDFKQQSPINLEPSRPGAQNIIDQFPALKTRNVEDYVYGGILDGLKKEGFFAEMERKYAKR